MDEPDSPAAPARISRWGGTGSSRTRILAASLGLVVVASLGGWFAGSPIASPAEIAARAQPPAASLVTVAVERRTLSADIVTRDVTASPRASPATTPNRVPSSSAAATVSASAGCHPVTRLVGGVVVVIMGVDTCCLRRVIDPVGRRR